MAIAAECIAIVNGARIPVSQLGKTFVLLNPAGQAHRLIVVDGCAIKAGPRCDNAIFLASGREIYIELKGTDLKHAYEQLAATIPLISECGDQGERVCIVVASRMPKEDSTAQNLRAKMSKKFKVGVVKKSRILESSEDSLF